MIIKELRNNLLDLIDGYFAGATVIWAQEKTVKPAPALVTLRMGNVSRPLRPIMQIVDGVPCGFYPSRVVLEVNLYTKGAAVAGGNGKTIARDNTAINDMLDFVNYLNSPFVTDWCYVHDIAITPNGDVTDVSAVVNDINWEYRAMAEFFVDFMQSAVGATGILDESSIKWPEKTDVQEKPERPVVPDEPSTPDDTEPTEKPLEPYIEPEWEQTDSGGGFRQLAEESLGYFEQVEIENFKRGDKNV